MAARKDTADLTAIDGVREGTERISGQHQLSLSETVIIVLHVRSAEGVEMPAMTVLEIL